jgi:hypothetical protein
MDPKKLHFLWTRYLSSQYLDNIYMLVHSIRSFNGVELTFEILQKTCQIVFSFFQGA